MQRVTTWIVGSLITVALPLAAESTRLRLENPGKEGRVEVVIARANPSLFEVRSDGLAGEVLVVEAPAPDFRLDGGSISYDPLLEALVNREVSRNQIRPRRIVVVPQRERRPITRRNVRPVYGFTDADFFVLPSPGYFRTTSSYSCAPRPVRQAPRAKTYSSRSTRGSITTRAVVPRY